MAEAAAIVEKIGQNKLKRGKQSYDIDIMSRLIQNCNFRPFDTHQSSSFQRAARSHTSPGETIADLSFTLHQSF